LGKFDIFYLTARFCQDSEYTKVESQQLIDCNLMSDRQKLFSTFIKKMLVYSTSVYNLQHKQRKTLHPTSHTIGLSLIFA
jgi:hypothetical protein